MVVRDQAAGAATSTATFVAARRAVGPAVVCGLVLSVGALGFSTAAAQVRGNAQAEQSRSLANSQVARGLPPPGRYVSESGEAFLVGQSGSSAILRFERRTETWLLRANPAPRGDTIYRNDAGAQILRVSAGGAVTLYTARSPGGSPATLTGAAPEMASPVLGPVRLANLMVQRSALVSRALGHTVVVQLDGERDEALCVEALIAATDAVIRMARSATTRGQLTELRSITIIEGGRSQVSFARGDLRVVVNPGGQGAGARPSSARVIQAVAGG